eukprot:Phypoly_transcript_09947.p1 GENE.Phypoly_transcript_09947~~Phypoly_transcript_09947.p1  ORF type:complete len:418 (+),score=49.08 Phypoly_transcript_09947:89-1342(+)
MEWTHTRLLFLGLFVLLCHSLPIAPGSYSQPLSKFAFGSCNKHDLPQPLWEHIQKYNPELWVWLGDIVYADTREMPFLWKPSALSVMEYKYDAQRNNKDYKKLASTVNITGVWDDHDYGMNNGGKFYSDRRDSQKILLKFLDEPKESERWNRDGLYGAFEFGESPRKVKLIIFDTRFFRTDPLEPNSDILGEVQWKWLEEELKTSDAQIHFFASSVQLIPADIPLVEKWSNFEHGRTRFFSLLQKYKISTPIVLSGDVHHAELFHYSCPESNLIVDEITSSGMTHCCASSFPSFICNTVLNTILFGKFSLGSYDGFNFGTVEIHWDTNPVTVDLQVRGVDGEIVMKNKVVSRTVGGGSTLCSEHIPRYVHWKSYTWFAIIIGILLSILVGLIYATILVYRKIAPIFRVSPKKKNKSK